MTQDVRLSRFNTLDSLMSVDDIKDLANTDLLKWVEDSQPASNFFAKQVHKKLAQLKRSSLTVIDPHGTYRFGKSASDKGSNINGDGGDNIDNTKQLDAVIRVKDMAVYKEIALGGTNGAAEAYLQGRWDTSDLTTVIRVFTRNREIMMDMQKGIARFASIAMKAWHHKNKNTKSGSQKNIASHYDLGNDFFRLFLDKEMMYSSYLYEESDVHSHGFDLDIMNEASRRKMQRICDQLALTEKDHLIEVGTGWGGFACFAAQTTGCKVTTTTISKEQHKKAVERVKAYGLEDKVTVLLDDYRDLTGTYDKLVSIEMIEAVGHQFLPDYFNKLSELLKPNGIGLIQAITIEDHCYEKAKNTVDYIKRYIFPGGFLPSVSEMTKHAGNNGLVLDNLYDMGLSYAKTLRDWRTQFFNKGEEVRSQNFDERFIRMWEYYLCYCEGGFDERAISVVQANFRKNHTR